MVTAILITWKRQENIPKIIENLLQYEFIDEILIRDNSKCKNVKCYARWLLAKKAKNDLIYVQDDDCIVHNIRGIYESFLKHPETISYSGIEGYEDKIETYEDCQLALLGWGAIFSKQWSKVLDMYVTKFGKDELFYSETDRIFSILLGKHHHFVSGEITHLNGSGDNNAMCNQVEHLDFKSLAIQRSIDVWNFNQNPTKIKSVSLPQV